MLKIKIIIIPITITMVNQLIKVMKDKMSNKLTSKTPIYKNPNGCINTIGIGIKTTGNLILILCSQSTINTLKICKKL